MYRCFYDVGFNFLSKTERFLFIYLKSWIDREGMVSGTKFYLFGAFLMDNFYVVLFGVYLRVLMQLLL